MTDHVHCLQDLIIRPSGFVPLSALILMTTHRPVMSAEKDFRLKFGKNNNQKMKIWVMEVQGERI